MGETQPTRGLGERYGVSAKLGMEPGRIRILVVWTWESHLLMERSNYSNVCLCGVVAVHRGEGVSAFQILQSENFFVEKIFYYKYKILRWKLPVLTQFWSKIKILSILFFSVGNTELFVRKFQLLWTFTADVSAGDVYNNVCVRAFVRVRGWVGKGSFNHGSAWQSLHHSYDRSV